MGLIWVAQRARSVHSRSGVRLGLIRRERSVAIVHRCVKDPFDDGGASCRPLPLHCSETCCNVGYPRIGGRAVMRPDALPQTAAHTACCGEQRRRASWR